MSDSDKQDQLSLFEVLQNERESAGKRPIKMGGNYFEKAEKTFLWHLDDIRSKHAPSDACDDDGQDYDDWGGFDGDGW